MSDAHEALIQTLLARGGPDCRLTSSGERPWASITFEGARHVVEVELLTEAADPFMEDIEEAAFDLRHHLLADLTVVSRGVPVDGRVRVRFEALTLARSLTPLERSTPNPRCMIMGETKLRYVDDSKPGITRQQKGRAWAYFDAKGDRITDRDEIDRLNKVALPPAYRDAWYSPHANGHIQATGTDDRGRKQYRYHVDFRAQQDALKYEKCADFGRALPKLRARVDADLAGRKLARDTVLAAVVRLLDLGRIRVGNETYARENKSFGATTLRNRHAKVSGGKLRLEYTGKSGKKQRLTIEDRRLAAIVKRTQDLPGQHLFEYLDDEGQPHAVGSGEVNDYIRDATGGEFTAKHFRTWGATLLAFEHIVGAGEGGKLSLKPMLEQVAAALGNTPAISRKSYVHPALIDLCRTGDATGICTLKLPRATRWLTSQERALISFLDEIAILTAKDAPKGRQAA